MNDPANDLPPVWKRRGLVLGDLTDDLLWPRLLRAPALALRPPRLLLALMALLAASLIARIPAWWGEGESFGEVWTRARSAPAWDAFAELGVIGGVIGGYASASTAPLRLIADHPGHAVLFGVPILAVLALAGAAIARLAVAEFARGVMLPWTVGVGFALARASAVLSAVFLPLVVVGVIAASLAVAGFLLLNWALPSVLGSILYPAALALSLIAVLATVGLLAGWPLLGPAVAAEGGAVGGDGLDAVQRTYAYVTGRPLRLALYLIILVAQLGVMLWLLDAIASGVTTFAAWACGWFMSAEAVSRVFGPAPPDAGAAAFAWRTVAFWETLPGMLVAAFGVSYAFSAGSILYLIMRRLNDGEEETEVTIDGDADHADNPALQTMPQPTPQPARAPESVGDAG